VRVCVTGATGFIGGHVARLLAARGDDVRVTFRDRGRLDRLEGVECEPVAADVLERDGMRRAARGCEVLVHAAGLVAARPRRKVWEVNADSPAIAVEAAAAEGVRRVVLTSSVAAIGPARGGQPAEESQSYRGDLRLVYGNAKAAGEQNALAAAERLGVELVVTNPAYVIGVPVNPSLPDENSSRIIGHYLRGRLPAIVGGRVSLVDVRDVAEGHLAAADRGRPGERYILAGHNLRWAEVIDRVAELAGVGHQVIVLPRKIAAVADAADRMRMPAPIATDAYVGMAQNWSFSSAKAERELGYRVRPLDETLRATIRWFRDLEAAGAFDDQPRSVLSTVADGVRAGRRLGIMQALRASGELVGRRTVAGG
jgi:dihydroflavonol-4-reductase